MSDSEEPSSKQLNTNEDTELLYELVRDSSLLSHVVLIGASALIPIPFLDDLTKGFLQRRLLTSIAEREGLQLEKQDCQHLQHKESSGCCALGCLSSAILYPLKRVLRKLFFFLEIKRAVDQSTTALAQAWLLQLTLRKGMWQPNSHSADTQALRRAIQKSCRHNGVKPLELAFRQGFKGAKGTFQSFASKFTRDFKTDEREIEVAVNDFENQQKNELENLSQKLSGSLDQVSSSYLENFVLNFQEQLTKELAAPRNSESA